jgi:hypothetical protein
MQAVITDISTAVITMTPFRKRLLLLTLFSFVVLC